MLKQLNVIEANYGRYQKNCHSTIIEIGLPVRT